MTSTQQSDGSPSKASPQQSSELADMHQGLQESNAALQAAQIHLSARQEEVLELTQRLEAAQADIASLQVRKAISLHLAPYSPLVLPFSSPLPPFLPHATHMRVSMNAFHDKIKCLLHECSTRQFCMVWCRHS